MTTITVDEAIVALKAMSGIDFNGAITALEDGNIQGDLKFAGSIAGVVADFIPEAKYVQDAIEVLSLIVAARKAGLWAPANDPAALNGHNQPTSAG